MLAININIKKIIPALIVLGLMMFGSKLALSHVDNYLLPEECGSCHAGHGMPGEPMLNHSEEEMCFQCHGSSAKQSVAKAAGKLAGEAELKDIESVFKKVYRHPIFEGSGHQPNEKLPAVSLASITHAECVDCHNPHQKIVKTNNKVYKVPGYSLSRQYLDISYNEYEVCLKCHSQTLGFNNPKDMGEAFSLSVVSQHPVTKLNNSKKSISLKSSAATDGHMKCSDCHTNDDKNGPQGPHGSNYRFILSGKYEIDVYADESPFAYEFCYSCHDRQSILNNSSFPLHEQHIVGDMLGGRKGTSCYTCHSSHSSQTYDHLIKFNPEGVTPDNTTGQLVYRTLGVNKGECYLNCHGYNHTAAKY